MNVLVEIGQTAEFCENKNKKIVWCGLYFF